MKRWIILLFCFTVGIVQAQVTQLGISVSTFPTGSSPHLVFYEVNPFIQYTPEKAIFSATGGLKYSWLGDYLATNLKCRIGAGQNYFLGVYGEVSPFVRLKKIDVESRFDIFTSYGFESGLKVTDQIGLMFTFGWLEYPLYSEYCGHGSGQCSYFKSFDKSIQINLGVKYRLKNNH